MPLQRTHLLIKRFPEHWGRILELGARSDRFRTLCVDYQDAIAAARWWHDHDRPNAAKHEQEYLDVIHQLEIEIVDMLSANEVNSRARPEQSNRRDS